MQPITVFPDKKQHSAGFLNREWLCANGLGSYASGTLLGVNTRRDHGLLIPYFPQLKSRAILVAHMVETIKHKNQQIDISGFEFVDGKISSQAEVYLKEFQLDHLIPTWIFSLGKAQLQKRILTPWGRNMAIIEYRLLAGNALRMELAPFFTYFVRGNPLYKNRNITFSKIKSGMRVGYNQIAQTVVMRISGTTAIFKERRNNLANIYYREEYERGNEPTDFLLNPGSFELETSGDPVFVCFSLGNGKRQEDVSKFFDKQKKRLDTKISGFGFKDSFSYNVCLAADQFIFNKAEGKIQKRKSDRWSILAGFHWFLDWGRDSMISLEGLTLCTKKFEIAKNILMTLSGYVKNGLLFNSFDEGQNTPRYNSADATLWFFHALGRYIEYTSDMRLARNFYPLLVTFANSYLNGAAQGIRVDPKDGLIAIYSENEPLTWMDAQVFGAVFTPRNGKPVEIQALWFNALKLLVKWSKLFGYSSQNWENLSLTAQKSFDNKFWFAKGGYLFDVIEGPQGNDNSLRPNQIFSLALENPVLAKKKWKQVVDICRQELLTGYGLRSLSPKDRIYRPHYKGNRFDRDSAYHQGAVWAWLVGYFIDAWLKVYPDKKTAYGFLSHFKKHLSEAGIGSISEIFDGSYPHVPRGCIAQAWSVAEVFRSISKLKGLA